MSNPLQVTKVGKCLFLPPLYSQGTSYFLDSGKQLQTGEAGKGRGEEEEGGREGGRKKRKEGGREGGRKEERESGKERWGLWENRREEEGKKEWKIGGKEGRQGVRETVLNSTISYCT